MIAYARQQPEGEEVYLRLAETFSALADANRAKILHSLANGELNVSDIAATVGVSESAVSQHLRILRTLRLVKGRKDGRRVFYSVNDEHIGTLLTVCLDHVLHP